MELPNRNQIRFSLLVVSGLFLCSLGCDQTKPQGAGSATSGKAVSGTEGTSEQRFANSLQGDSSNSSSSNENSQKPLGGGSGNSGTEAKVNDQQPEGSTNRVFDQADIMKRAFMTLQAPVNSSTEELSGFLVKVDEALRDLLVAGSNQMLDEQTFTKCGLRLGRMKFEAGERLSQASDATDVQRKQGTVAQLVALSHMSGLKDVESARKLEKFAAALTQSQDEDLAHQGRVVMLGFRLQELQNGQSQNPDVLLQDAKQLFKRPQDRGFPAMMVLQQAQHVLLDMGYKDAASQIERLVIDTYIDLPDAQLSMEAWNLAASKSQAFANYQNALQDLFNNPQAIPESVVAAARGIIQDLPYATTLYQLTSTTTDIEYRGHVQLAADLRALIRQALSKHTASQYVTAINYTLDAQEKRMSIVGQDLNLEGLVDFSGKSLDWSQYRGKVVLLDFWATWCMPCIREIKNIRPVYDAYNSQGFEVVGINMDEELLAAEQFLTSNSIPWLTVHSSDAANLGFKSNVAKSLGISGIPFLVLVDRSGKVAVIHVRGERLEPIVKSLLQSSSQ